jgi:hypothetical protein
VVPRATAQRPVRTPCPGCGRRTPIPLARTAYSALRSLGGVLTPALPASAVPLAAQEPRIGALAGLPALSGRRRVFSSELAPALVPCAASGLGRHLRGGLGTLGHGRCHQRLLDDGPPSKAVQRQDWRHNKRAHPNSGFHGSQTRLVLLPIRLPDPRK